MLNPEHAKKRLEAFEHKEKVGRRLDRSAALPAEARAVVFALLDRDAQGKPFSGKMDWQEKQRLKSENCARLETLGDADRVAVFETFFPGMAPHVERAWQAGKGLPYQISYQRKAFRAPNAPEASLASRVAWLEALVGVTAGYDEQTVAWFAQWTPYLGYYTDPLARVLAAAIDGGGPEGQEVFDILLQSGRGEHEIGAMGRHVTRGLLLASRPEGWEFVEKMLLAAQRQEGLRQAILEAIDESHPEAFRRMLRLITEHDLTRFSATIRALDVWFGFGWDVQEPSVKEANAAVGQIATFLDDAAARGAAIAGADPRTRYLALWATAFEDAPGAIPLAAALLHEADPELRFVGAHLLAQVGLPEAKEALRFALQDADLRVAARAFQALSATGYYGQRPEDTGDLFEHLERALPRFPARAQKLGPVVWPWMTVDAHQESVADALVRCLGDRSPKRLIPYRKQMSVYGRSQIAEKLGALPDADAEVRDALLALAGDAAEWVRGKAFAALGKATLATDEAPRLEALLSRKSNDLRRGVLQLLLKQPADAPLASADRLLGAKSAPERQAGLEMLAEMVKAERAPDAARARARRYREERPQESESEAALLDALLDAEREVPTLDNALGLMDPANRTKPAPPKMPKKWLFFEGEKASLTSDAAKACIRSLDALVHEHRETPVRVPAGYGQEDTEEALLGNLRYSWLFPMVNLQVPLEDDIARLPLRDVWEAWYLNRPAGLRDADGMELLRAAAVERAGVPKKELKYADIVERLIGWLVRMHPPAGAADFLLDAVETSFAQIPADLLARKPPEDRPWDMGWRNDAHRIGYLYLARSHRQQHKDAWESQHHVRLWGLLRWMDEPGTGVPRLRPALDEVLTAFGAGGATVDDLYDQLLGPRATGHYGNFNDLQTLSGRKVTGPLETYPALRDIVERCRTRILEVELERGELPTAASKPAAVLRWAGGLATLARLLPALGEKTAFTRGRSWRYSNDESRAAVFSHLIRATFPGPDDTPEAFAQAMQKAKVGQKRLIELAVYAPQWARHVEQALGWTELAEGVWWLHAHTKDTQWDVEADTREAWAAQVSERTPLTGENLLDGAVDVAWFHRVHAALGDERWGALDEAARYASGGGGHKRAQLFASAMLGQEKKEILVSRITEKRHQDAVRALGLLPLPENDHARDAEVLARYQTIQEFVRSGRTFGSQRQASEKLAAGIALENLARTAGFPDPARLEWAMEAREIADLADGPVTATVGDVSVTLSINPLGEPDLAITKNGKALKAIPPAVKKDPAVQTLQERRQAAKRQTSRMRLSLESAMNRGDVFRAGELRDLFAHPILAPMLRNLVFIGDSDGSVAGYPVDEGRALEGYNGSAATPLADDTPLRIAHPHDLFVMGDWHHWQRDCFLRERVQPFKQVFRELYVRSDQETTDGTMSRRYAGHQVNPKQALALLGRRGWVSNPEEGDVRRAFHDAGLVAWLGVNGGYTTPLEVEGLTIEDVRFTRRGEWKSLPLSDIPPRVFSEVMRDLDLVVSVAHQGGVDPEASASTVEMRESVLRETSRLLKLDNVRFQGSHALIDGKLGTYSVHLGSAVVHRQPGGHLCIVPVHSQHRGRLFLPFVDDDPRTAEVVSKVLLLSKDTEIKDPTILEQILAR